MKTMNYSDFGIDLPNDARGAEVQLPCPQCSRARRKANVKCLSVNVDKECWICHHCDWRGSLKSGVQETSNPTKWQPKSYIRPLVNQAESLDEKALTWFQSRGISPGVLKRNRITYGPVYMPQIEDTAMAIQFSFYRGDELINIKYRDGKKNFRMVSGAERLFYGLNDLAVETIIVEGEMDKLAFEEAGYINCISVPDGAPSPKAKDYSKKFDFLENCEEQLQAVERFILAVDSDEPGKVLEEELARRLGRERCFRIQWPDGCKDANQVLLEKGVNELKQVIENAKPYPLKGIFEVLDLIPNVLRLFDEGLTTGNKTGWQSLDNHYTVRAGEWTIVTGIPGHGKSELIDALMVNLSKHDGWNFAIFSPENYPPERHLVKLCEKIVGKAFDTGHMGRMKREEVEETLVFLNNHFSFIYPEDDILALDNILKLAQSQVFRRGIKGLVIDPWNEIDHARPNNLSETEYISKSLTKIRQFARQNGVHVWVIAHPAKLYKDKDGNYPVPTTYDVSGSAHWKNKADNALTVWRDVKKNDYITQVHVQKIRFKEIGKLGMATLLYDYRSGRYYDQKEAS